MSSASLTFLLYHIVFSVKNRDVRLDPQLRLRMYPYMGGIIKKLGGIPIIINGTSNHVHILCFLPKHLSISECIKIIKARSSLWHNRVYDNNNHSFHWQDGYGVFSVSGENLEKVKHYIANQETHHSHLTFDDEWLALHNKLIDYTNVMEMDYDIVED
ncbi:MAG: IS200/IS605 family transposase [Candidatus Cloacimonetes bacterium]|nr:IS200/IS605 family transposase [Candidatus Cloacimonadota bacterium]